MLCTAKYMVSHELNVVSCELDGVSHDPLLLFLFPVVTVLT